MELRTAVAKVGLGTLGVLVVIALLLTAPHPRTPSQPATLVTPISPIGKSAGVPAEPAGTTTASVDAPLYTVVKVIDGDTIVVNIGGTEETVRLIGINTPETVDPRKPVECFGKEASARAKQVLTGARVRLEQDPTQGERDKYGRLLAYVYLADGTSFNEYMIREGYAYEYTYHTPYKYQSAYKAAEASARTGEKGLWAAGVCDVAVPVSVPATVDGYVCSVNTYNCTDFATHAEAQAVFEACGGSAHDVHLLDRDHDGLACETLP